MKKTEINPKARVFYTFIFVLVYLVFVHIIYRYQENQKQNDFYINEVFTSKVNLIKKLTAKGLTQEEIIPFILEEDKIVFLSFNKNPSEISNSKTIQYKEFKIDNNLSVTMGIDTKKLNKQQINQLYEDILIGCIFLFFIYPFLVAVRREIRAENKHKLEQEKIISRQHRLAQMGQLLNNIAHQFRQPLTQINATMASLEVMHHKKKLTSHKLDEKISQVEEVTEYLSNTIDDFRNYFRKNKSKEEFLISDAVNKSIKILANIIEENQVSIKIENIHDNKLYHPPGEYTQTIIALITNSIDQLRQNQIENPHILIKIDTSLYIIDNAGGVKEEYIDKIFDLDFTTKNEKKGTGLGLYMTKMLVENSFDGHITVENYQDGVKFKIDVKGINE